MTKPRLVMMRDAVMSAGLAMLIGMASAGVKAAEVGDSPPSWQGLWVAAGTPFALRLEQSAPGEAIGLRQVESLGFEWTATSVREVEGKLLVDVEYAGVVGTIQVQLRSRDSALAAPLSCTPEYMVVCVLSKGQQALFLRQN